MFVGLFPMVWYELAYYSPLPNYARTLPSTHAPTACFSVYLQRSQTSQTLILIRGAAVRVMALEQQWTRFQTRRPSALPLGGTPEAHREFPHQKMKRISLQGG